MQPWFSIVFVDVILSFGSTIDVSIGISRIHWIRWNRGRWNRGRWFHLATRFANDELKGLRIISVTPSTCKHSTCCSCSVVFSRSRKESFLWHFPRGLGFSSWVGNNQSSTPLLPVGKKTKCVATVLDKDEPYCAWTEKNPQASIATHPPVFHPGLGGSRWNFCSRELRKLETFILSISGDEFRILSSELFGELEDAVHPGRGIDESYDRPGEWYQSLFVGDFIISVSTVSRLVKGFCLI